MKRFTVSLIVLILFAPASFMGGAAAADAEASTTRISVATDGTEGNGASARPSISADGRYVAFQSWATNLVVNDTNNAWDIFVHDRTNGVTTRVSVATNGDQANGSSYAPSISADGRYVAFQSDANNIVADDSNGHSDIFIHDLQNGTTAIVSLAQDGSPANGDSSDPSVNGDGHHVAFTSDASNLVSNDADGVADVYVRDVAADHTVLASTTNAQDLGNRGSSGASISNDGRFTVYASQTTSLGPSLDHPEIYVYDRNDGSDTMVSISNDGAPSNGSTYRPAISGNGEYVVFDSGDTTNLVAGMTGGVFMHNLETDVTTGVLPTGIAAQLNIDGRFVVFAASRQYLSPTDPTGAIDVYRLDRQTGTTIRVSQNDSGEPGNGESGTYELGASGHATSVSETGQFVAFTSSADNLVPGDTNDDWDVFVADLGPISPVNGPSVPTFVDLTPAPFSTVPPVMTHIGATVQSDSPLSTLVLLVDGNPTNSQSGLSDISAQVDLSAGTHTITVFATDANEDTSRRSGM